MSLIRHILLLILIPLTTFAPRAVAKDATFDAVPGEFVIKMKRGKTLRSALKSLVEKQGLNLQAESFATDHSFALVRVKNMKSAQALQLLSSQSEIEYAEPNYIFRAAVMTESSAEKAFNEKMMRGDFKNANPNDSLYQQLWGLKNIGQTDAAGQVGVAGADIEAEAVWQQGRVGDRKIKVAVIDTGVDYTHADLRDNMWVNSGEIAGNGVDDDGNGLVDDIRGWNFATNTADPMDDHYHGTHCAGTIGALANNGVGVAGVAWQVTMVPIKFLTAQGSGTLAGAVQSIQYATKVGVDIMSNSWGGGPFTQSLYDVIQEATQKGIVFIAAAGNDGKDNDGVPSYPASYQIPGVISVAATDNRDQIANFSNWGRSSVHVSAPGVKILSTVPASQGEYKMLSGTSMATPHVSGMVAVYLADRGTLNPEDVKTALVRSSDPSRPLSKKSVSQGRVNLKNLVEGITPEPISSPAESAWVDYAAASLPESAHPYADNQNYQFQVNVPGARFVRLIFDRIDVESGYDFVTVKQSDGQEIEKITGSKTQYTSDYLEGDTAQISLKTDSSQTGYGFKVAKVQVIY